MPKKYIRVKPQAYNNLLYAYESNSEGFGAVDAYPKSEVEINKSYQDQWIVFLCQLSHAGPLN